MLKVVFRKMMYMYIMMVMIILGVTVMPVAKTIIVFNSPIPSLKEGV